MTQQRLRLASLTVVGGPLDGHRCALDDVVSELLIGSDPGCNLVIDLPTVSPIHAKIWADLDASMVRDTHAPRGVYVNATRVEAETQLKPRDLLWLGSPGDPQSVCVLPEFEAWVERIPEAVLPKDGAAPAAAVAGAVSSDAFEPQSYAPAFEPQALEASAFEAPTDETRALPQTAQASGPGSEPQVFELEQAIQDGDASDPFFVSDAPPSTEAGSVPASVDEQAVVDGGVAPVRIDLSSQRAAEAPADALAESAGVGFDDDSFALQTEATASASEAIISEEIEAVFAAPAEPKSAAPAPAAAAAVPDEDLWAISAEPEAAQPDSPASAEAEDEFLLAEPGAEPETPEPTLLVSAAEAPAASWPAAQAPPPAPAPSARQVPLPPVAPSSSPAPLAAPRSAADHPAAARPAAAQPAAARPAAPPATPHRAPAPLAAHAPSAAAAHAGPGAHGAASMPVDVPDSELAPPPRPAAAATGRKPVARGGAQRRRGMPGWMLGAIASAAVLLLAGAGVVGWQLFGGRVQVDAISPLPVRAGQRATLRGSGFSTTASENVVTFEGLPARVVAATGISLEVEVPPGAIETGTQRRMNVVVRKGSKQSQPIPVDVLQAPRLHGISPLAALPGEPVLLAGAGWGPGARVRFGNVEAQTVEIAADRHPTRSCPRWTCPRALPLRSSSRCPGSTRTWRPS